jgi:mono/diheme cytochrome c family protein
VADASVRQKPVGNATDGFIHRRLPGGPLGVTPVARIVHAPGVISLSGRAGNLSYTGKALIVFLLLFGLVAGGLGGCDYGRMKEQEAVQTYKAKVPEMPAGSIPVKGGLQAAREAGLQGLKNPLVFGAASVSRGREAYGHYCVMCHGKKGDGKGTVGQSFAPLPTDLRAPPVQTQEDGKLFYTITFGLRRHPGLGFMTTDDDRWAMVHYIRTLGGKAP